MKISIFNILVMVLVSFLFSCKQENKKQENTIVIQFDSAENGRFDVLHMEYIPLETTEQSLIGEISKIIYKNERFYILDKYQSRSVLIFDRNGKFVSSINKVGEGPGEYIEIMDMDIDDANNIYIADNGKTDIIKYIQADPDRYETFHVGEHFFDFCYLKDNTFVLKDLFGKNGRKTKLAIYKTEENSIYTLLENNSDDINEMDILRCSKKYLYRTKENVFYNDRFTSSVYNIEDDGTLSELYTVASEKYIPRAELKNLERNPQKFISENRYIKDVVGLYENDRYFICMPYITPSATYLVVPKKDPQTALKIDLLEKDDLHGVSLIEAVADNKFVAIMNYTEKQATKLKNNPTLKSWKEESNPVLVLFDIDVK